MRYTFKTSAPIVLKLDPTSFTFKSELGLTTSPTPTNQWKFNESSGNSITDNISGNDGTKFFTANFGYLVGYWPFSGDANEINGTHNGTVTGATLTTDRLGNSNSAYHFDGTPSTNEYVSCGAIAIPHGATINCWIKGNGTIVENTYPISWDGKMGLLGLHGDGTHRMGLITRNAADTEHGYYQFQDTSPIDVWDEEWHMYTVAWDATYVYCWADGQSAGTPQAHSGDINFFDGANKTLYFGTWTNSYGTLNGDLSEVMIRKDVLRDKEVLDLYNLGLTRNLEDTPFKSGKIDNCAETNSLYSFNLDSKITMDNESSSMSFWANITDSNRLGACVTTTGLGGQGTEHVYIGNSAGGSDCIFYMEPTTNGVDVKWDGESGIANGWHHFVFTQGTGGAAKLYIDKVDQGTPDSTTKVVTDNWDIDYISGTNGFRNAGDYDGNYGYYATLQLDDFRIFDVTLTQEQVSDIYNGGLGNEGSNLNLIRYTLKDDGRITLKNLNQNSLIIKED